MITANVQQKMDLKEAKQWLRKDDNLLIAKTLKYSPATVSYVLNMRRNNPHIKNAIISLAEKRKNDYEASVEEILHDKSKTI